jgi:hypothetical protein
VKYIKNFLLFESIYTTDEYTSSLINIISDYDITQLNLIKVLDKKSDEINQAMSDGVPPQEYAKNLLHELELTKNGNYNGFIKTFRSQSKYL